MSIIEKLEDMGLSPEQIGAITEACEQHAKAESLTLAGELIHRVFLRVDRDSVAGRALARALGFTNDTSLARAAKDFGIEKQYLGRLQAELKSKLRGL